MNPVMSDAERELRAECLALRSRLEEQAYELRDMRDSVAEHTQELTDRVNDIALRLYLAFVVALTVVALAHLLLP